MKRKPFKHLRQNDRDRVEALEDAGHSQVEISRILGVNPGTVSREIKKRKRKDGRYSATTAQQKADQKRRLSKYQGMKVESDLELKAYIIAGLKEKRSPDEIAGRMRREKQPWYVSKNAIYDWLRSAHGQRYCPLLCTQRYNPKKRKKPASKRTMIPNRVSIDERPKSVINKTRYRHFEVDTAVAPKKSGNTEGVALAAERKAKYLAGTKIPGMSPRHMTAAVKGFTEKLNMLTATGDNGIENKEHELWGIPAYFADPHSPWQKPVVENSIGLLRRWFFPKGTDWSKVSEEELQTAIRCVNHKYRKSLHYQSAYEVALAHGIIKKEIIP